VGEKLAVLAREYRPIKLRLDSLGVFPKPAEPKIIYIKTEEFDGEIFDSMAFALGRELEKLGIDIKHRPWRPHITIGRVKYLSSQLDIDSIAPSPLRFEIKSIELMESDLSGEYPEYKIIESYKL